MKLDMYNIKCRTPSQFNCYETAVNELPRPFPVLQTYTPSSVCASTLYAMVFSRTVGCLTRKPEL